MSEGGQIADRLQGAGFVVGGHHRHQHSVLVQGGGQRGRVQQAVAIHRQHRHPGAVQALQGLAGLEQGGVLGGLGDDVGMRMARGEDRAAQGEQVGLRAGGGEHDLVRAGADQVGDLGAGLFQCYAPLLGVVVAAGGGCRTGPSGTAASPRPLAGRRG